MAISNLTASHTYNGDGSTLGPHTISFDYFASGDIQVYVGGVLKTISTHYTITNGSTSNGHFTGGTLNFTSGNAPASGTGNIYIACNTAATQPLDVSTLNSFNEDQLEQVFDRLVLIARDAKEQARIGITSTQQAAIATAQAVIATAQAVIATAAASTASAAQVSAAASANIATSAAASASAIAAGSLYAYTSSSGTVTAVNGAGYSFTATGTINLPVPTAGHVVRAILNASSGSTLTLVRNGGTGNINNIAENGTIIHSGIFFMIADGTSWLVTGNAIPGV